MGIPCAVRASLNGPTWSLNWSVLSNWDSWTYTTTALGRGSQSHVAASAEAPPQRTNQSSNVEVNDGNFSARSGCTGATPQRGELAQRVTTRGRGPCRRCGQQGHFARNCQNSSQGPNAHVQQGPAKIQVVTDRNSKRDVYLPVNLFGRRTVALLDT